MVHQVQARHCLPELQHTTLSAHSLEFLDLNWCRNLLVKELGWFENCLLWQGKKKNRGKSLHRFALVAKFWILTNGGPANMAEKEFKKNKKWTLVTFLCIITRRNKTVAYTFLEFNFFFEPCKYMQRNYLLQQSLFFILLLYLCLQTACEPLHNN